MDAPILSILSAIGGTLTVAFTIDPAFPAATTTFWIIDPATGQPAFPAFGPGVPPSIVIAGLSEDADYELVAQSFDAGSGTTSPPSAPIRISPIIWDGKLKNVIVADPRHDSREYKLYNEANDVELLSSLYPSFIDNQTFATERAAQEFSYRVRAFGPDNQEDGCVQEIVRVYRTFKALCLVTGEVSTPGGDGDYDWPVVFTYREEQRWPQDPDPVQRAYAIPYEVKAYPNYLGQWGVYLLQGARVEMWNGLAQGPRNRIEVVVPAAATVDFVDLPQVPRPHLPKRT